MRIGLTGGIGSGKSTVSAMLGGLGAAVIDTDRIAREITLPGGAAIEALRAEFGPGFIATDGSLDRSRMRELAFAEPGAKKRLEAILHPLIGIEVERQAGLATAVPACVFDVPLLVESGRWRSRVDYVWVVDCDESTQVERVVARSQWSEPDVRAVIAQQATRAARRAAADAVIVNEGIGLAELRAQTLALWEATTSMRR